MTDHGVGRRAQKKEKGGRGGMGGVDRRGVEPG